MNPMRHSKNFAWMDSGCVGAGASGYVYKGFDLRNGKTVAIKTYKHNFYQEIVELQQKECEILKDLSHENVVKLLSFEKENSHNRNNVLVMEFCNGGNLYEVLSKPENFYGFEQEELLCVLQDITAAMKYLREKRLIHRDIKPLNIMRHKLDNEKLVNKLADFGTARYLGDSQDFDSVHGTKAYLFIKMYEKRVMKQNKEQTFKSTVDLWSIGVTLYHLATGVLPFRSVKSEFDSKEIMYNIVMRKDIGDISGVENCNKSVTYSKELPDTCLINGDPKVLMTRLLAGLLEYNEDLMWTFDSYFNYVTDMFQQKVLHIFYANESKHMCFYMNPEQTVDDLKHRISEQTNSQSSNQLLLWDNAPGLFQSNSFEKVSILPDTSLDHPLIVLDLTKNSWTCLFESEDDLVMKFSGFLAFLLIENPSLKDYLKALKIGSIESHSMKRFIVKIVRSHKALLKTEILFKSWIAQSLREFKLKIDVLNQKFVCIKDYKYETVKKSFEEKLTQLSAVMLPELNKEFKLVDNMCTKFNSDFVEIKATLFQKEASSTKCSVLSSTSLEGCVETANTYVRRLQDCFDAYKRSINQTQVHPGNLCLNLERKQIMETVQSISDLQQHCLTTLNQALKKMQDWYSCIQESVIEYTRLETEFVSVNRKLDDFSSCLDKAQSEFLAAENVTPHKDSVEQIDTSLLLESNNNTISLDSQSRLALRKKPLEKILLGMQKLEDEQKSLWPVIEENHLIAGRLASLAQ